MSVKPINLSIMIGDSLQNITPHSTPRNNNYRNLSPIKSCSKSRSTSSSVPVSMKPNNKFRQWADPPPPPSRSRTADRKQNTTAKRRTGSVDSRFRRTLTDLTKTDNSNNKSLEEIKSEFQFCNEKLTALKETEAPKQQHCAEDIVSDQSCVVNKENTIFEIKNNTDFKTIFHTLEPPVIGKYKVNNELECQNPVFDYIEDSASEIFNNHKTAGCNQLKPKPCLNIEKMLLEPQTEILFGRIVDNFSQTDISVATKIKYDDRSSSDIFLLKDDESFNSDINTRDSQGTFESEANFICKKCSKNGKSKKDKYLRTLEIWSAVLTLSTIGALTWIYMVPYMEETVTNFYYNYVNPKPEPPTGIIQYLYQIYNFIEGVMSTPNYTRQK